MNPSVAGRAAELRPSVAGQDATTQEKAQGAGTQAATVPSGESQTITPMRRFMNETMLRAGQAAGQAQAGASLSQESVKDLVSSVSQQYSLRQNVIQQAVAAIEDAGQTASHVRINLQPASLGSLTVSLSMEGGKLTARLVASSDDVRDVLAANLTQFKQALESQGLQVNSLSVAVRADAGASQGQPQQAPWQQARAVMAQAPMEQDAVPLANPWSALVGGGTAAGNSTFTALA